MDNSEAATTTIPTEEGYLTRLWHKPMITVARFALRSHIQSWWVLGDLAFIWLLYAMFFLEFGGSAAYFYDIANQGLYVLAILDAIIIAKRMLSARSYLPLARLTSRASYVQGIILATALLRIPYFLLMLLLALSYHRHSPILGIGDATFGNMLPGAIGLLLNCVILSLIAILFSTPVATRRIQIGLLAWIAAIMYSNTSSDIVAHYLGISRIVMAPIAICYNFGLSGTFNGYDLLALLLAVGYIAALSWLVSFWFNKRDLILY